MWHYGPILYYELPKQIIAQTPATIAAAVAAAAAAAATAASVAGSGRAYFREIKEGGFFTVS
jgi:hypothetical protein